MEELNLSEDQQYALDTILSGKSVFLSGKAGTGKSFIINQIIKKLDNVVLLGTTGIAALNIGGQTMHSFFSLPIADVASKDKCFFVKQEKRNLWNRVKTIIIDEVSMLRADLLDCIEWTLQKNKCGSLTNKQIIFVGDLAQLPPVVKDSNLFYTTTDYKGPEFMHAKIASKLLYECIELTTIHRQKDREFIDALNILRNGNKTPYFKQFVTAQSKGIVLTPHVSTAISHNKLKLAELEEKLYTFENEIWTAEWYTKKIMPNEFNLPDITQLKSGARVMFMINIGKLVNGSMGTIRIEETENEPILYFDADSGKTIKLEKHEFIKGIYGINNKGRVELNPAAIIKQYPIKLAWAVTIHKSQGLTFDEITVDLTKDCFEKGQLYTAFSRVKTPQGLNILM
jgi:ATP-dependent exoDNAse (exonuclease V) alpha subunit